MTEIMKDNYDYIIIASLKENFPIFIPSLPGPQIGKYFEFYYYEFNPDHKSLWKSPEWVEDQPNQQIPEYEIQVTISAKPELVDTFTRNYKLSVDGLHEIKHNGAK